MTGYILAGALGFFIGVVLSCILLSKKNFEFYKNVEHNISTNVKENVDLKGSFEAAKKMYREQVEAYENGGTVSDDGSAGGNDSSENDITEEVEAKSAFGTEETELLEEYETACLDKTANI